MHRFSLFGLCLLAGVLLAPLPATGDNTRSQRAAAELDALRERIDSVRDRIAEDRSERSDLSASLSRIEAEVGRARRRLSGLDERIENAQDRVSELTTRRDAERRRLGDQLVALRRQVRAAHTVGDMNKMRLLLSGESPEQLGRMLVYYEYFANARSRQVVALREGLGELASRQNALKAERDALAEQREARTATLERLESSQQARRDTIAALDRQLSSRQASLEEMRADEARLEALMRRLQTQLADLPPVADDTPFGQLKGRMQPPVDGQRLARFGTRKNNGPLKWQGEWRAAAPGTPIRAVADGRVVYVGYMHRYGLIVVLDHGDDYYTLYGHAQSAYVDVGDRVARGEPVAQAGQSGGHARSGAYFELRRGRTPIDPATWLAG